MRTRTSRSSAHDRVPQLALDRDGRVERGVAAARTRRRTRRPASRRRDRPAARRRVFEDRRARRRSARGSRRRADATSAVEPSMSVISIVTKPDGSCDGFARRAAALRSDCSWPVMNPTGTIPNFLAAFSSRLRARSRARSSSNLTWPNRASALRTCASSWIGSRRRPRESTYANALSGRSARFVVSSLAIAETLATLAAALRRR